MKKLSRKGTVHPSPPLISDHLAFLPATILTLATALSPEDREVLAYLISRYSGNFSDNRRNTQKTNTAASFVSGGGGGKDGDHPASFNCNCFRCYTSYWVRWDSSPSRQLIHEIIDALEDGLAQGKREKNKRDRRKRGSKRSSELDRSELTQMSLMSKDEFGEADSVEETVGDGGEGGFGKGSVGKLVSFIGERFWGVWNQGK